MGNGEYATTLDLSEIWDRLQVFDCNDSRPTSLAKFFNSAGGHSNFPDVFSRLNPKAQNEIDDSLVKNIRSFHRSFYFIGCFIHV